MPANLLLFDPRRRLRAVLTSFLGIFAVLIPAALPAQHPAMEIGLVSTHPRPISSVLGVTTEGVWVVPAPNSAALGADRQRPSQLVLWRHLDLETTRPHAVAALLEEAKRLSASGQPLPLPLGEAVDAALGRVNPDAAPAANSGSISDSAAEPAPGESAPRRSRRGVTPETAFEIWPSCRLVPHNSNDGDSFHIIDQHGQEKILRLYFVDCAETNNAFPERVADQAQAFGVGEDATLALGHYAAAVTETLLGTEPFTVLTAGQDARGRSRLPRVFGFVVLSGRASTRHCQPSLDAELVARGLARRYGARADPPGPQTAESVAELLETLEQTAQAKSLGAWALRETQTPDPEAAAPAR